jgi:excisionase family DNA binding protein
MGVHTVTPCNEKEAEGVEQIAVRPAEAAAAIGIGRTMIYNLIRTGELPSIRVGKSIRVPVGPLREWVARNASCTTERSGETDRVGRLR